MCSILSMLVEAAVTTTTNKILACNFFGYMYHGIKSFCVRKCLEKCRWGYLAEKYQCVAPFMPLIGWPECSDYETATYLMEEYQVCEMEKR
jgi:hypothetical protein